MATNAKLKADLLKKLDVTPQRLSQLVKARKAELPMSTELATYTIAHENGLDISKYLDSETTREVRQLLSDLRNGGSRNADGAPGAPARSRQAQRKAATRKDVKIKFAGVDVGKIPALKQSHADDAKRMAERVYPTLYVFENSVRDLIERVLKDAHGKDWWKTAVPGTVQQTAEKHKKDEAKDPWHSKRGRREIDYVFLNELWAIIKHRWADFKPLFKNQAWDETLITSDMNVSRRVLAHMNPLDADDIRNIEAAFNKWVKQLQAVEGKLP
jgi:hypothetical protein